EETARTHPLRDLRRRLQREGHVSQISLGRLTSAAVSKLVAQVPGLPTEGDMPSRLYAESEGNPLFLPERIRDLLETGPTADRTPAPLSVQAVIAARLE